MAPFQPCPGNQVMPGEHLHEPPKRAGDGPSLRLEQQRAERAAEQLATDPGTEMRRRTGCDETEMITEIGHGAAVGEHSVDSCKANRLGRGRNPGRLAVREQTRLARHAESITS